MMFKCAVCLARTNDSLDDCKLSSIYKVAAEHIFDLLLYVWYECVFCPLSDANIPYSYIL